MKNHYCYMPIDSNSAIMTQKSCSLTMFSSDDPRQEMETGNNTQSNCTFTTNFPANVAVEHMRTCNRKRCQFSINNGRPTVNKALTRTQTRVKQSFSARK